ncbi:Bacterial transcriptional regulator [compost metagenome]
MRRLGYSLDRNNYINGVVVIAVPVFDSHQRMTHALVAAGLAEQLDAARVESLAGELQDEAGALSQLLAARN